MRPALPALALTAALLTGGCAGEGAPTAAPEPSATQPSVPSEPSEPSVPASPAAPASAAPTTAAPAPAEPELQTISLEVSGGTVTGDTGRVSVPMGSTFRLVVTADVADEVHVHGYDRYLDLQPGVPAEAEIVADVPGVFEVELHDAGTLLTRLAVG